MSTTNALLSLPPHFVIYVIPYTFFSYKSSGAWEWIFESILFCIVALWGFLDEGLTNSF